MKSFREDNRGSTVDKIALLCAIVATLSVLGAHGLDMLAQNGALPVIAFHHAGGHPGRRLQRDRLDPRPRRADPAQSLRPEWRRPLKFQKFIDFGAAWPKWSAWRFGFARARRFNTHSPFSGDKFPRGANGVTIPSRLRAVIRSKDLIVRIGVQELSAPRAAIKDAIRITRFGSLMQFSDLGLSEKVLRAVEKSGYTTPTPIQAQAIPHALAGRDVLGIAQTGTGKTAAFTLPMLSRLEQGRARARVPRTLILEPTRELAAQVEESLRQIWRRTQAERRLADRRRLLRRPGNQDHARRRRADRHARPAARLFRTRQAAS